MDFTDYRSESAMLKLLIDYSDDLIELLEEDIFLSRQAKKTYRTIGALSFHGKITIRSLMQSFVDDENMTQFVEMLYKQSDVGREDFEHIMKALQTAHTKHEAYQYAQDIIQSVLSEEEDDEIRKIVENGRTISIYGTKEELYEHTFDSTRDWYIRFMEECSNPTQRDRLQISNMPKLNDTFGGLDKTDLIMICAKSGHGKTSVALNLAKDFAIDQEKTVYYVNSEMTTDQLRERIMSNMAEIDAKEIDRRMFSGSTTDKHDKHFRLAESVDEFAKKKLILSQVPTIYPSKIKKAVKQMTLNKNRPDVIFVDYIRHMDPEVNTRGMQEYQIMYECAEACKRLAKDLKIPVIALAQLNDQGMLEGSKKMRNACDGLLFFKEIPRNTDDIDDPKEKMRLQKEIDSELSKMSADALKRADYKFIKEKVRRGDPSEPIYIRFKKNLMRVNEVG